MDSYSILMTVYEKDSPQFFLLSVNSMLNQTVLTDDFVLVCDGTLTDELYECISQVKKGHENIFNVISLPQNVGLGKALRAGLLNCKNEIVARMDDDDIAYPERCKKELDYLHQHPEVAIVSSNVSEFVNTPEEPLRIKHVPIGVKAIQKYAKRRNPLNHSAVMFRKSKVIEAGNYSEMRTNQDVELWIRMLNNGYLCDNLDEVLVDFRFDSKTLERRKEWKNSKLMIEVWHDFYKKGYCSFQDFVYVTCVQIAIYIMPKRMLKWAYNKIR